MLKRYRHLLILTILLLGGGLYSVRAGWTLTASGPAIPLGHGATQVTKTISKIGRDPCQLTLVFFDESQCVLQVAANTSKKDALSLETMAGKAGAIAACNGGYFDPRKMIPTGLEIAGGIRAGTFDSTLPFGGLLLVKGGKPSILTSEEFSDGEGMEGLLQCCPRLVENGRPIEGIGGEQPATRTFILTDGKGRWAIGISQSIGAPDLASMLSNRKIISEFQVQRVLNLDGGPSTGLWCRHATGKVTYSPEKWMVRNAILIRPLKQGE